MVKGSKTCWKCCFDDGFSTNWKNEQVVFPQDTKVFFNLKTARIQFTETYVEFLSN